MSLREKFSSFDRKNLGALVIIGFVSLMFVGYGSSQSSGTPDVSFGQNGIQINSGGLDTGGGDISDGGTTIWDSSNGEIPDSVLGVDLSSNAGNDLSWDSTNEVFDVDSSSIQSGTSASDVGLGNVRNIDLANTGGSDISYDTGSDQYNVDSNSIQSGTTASDVGLGNVQNEGQVAESGDSMSGDLKMGGNGIHFSNSDGGTEIISFNDGDLSVKALDQSDSELSFSSKLNSEFSFNDGVGEVLMGTNTDHDRITFDSDTGTADDITILDDADMNVDGSFDVDGSKNWVHSINSTHELVYSSQESPEVRAVYEGESDVNEETRIDLPSHFSKTVSDSRPKLRATATVQGDLAYTAVIEKTDDYIVLDSSEPATVNYRITGIREGYEDKQVVREKEE